MRLRTVSRLPFYERAAGFGAEFPDADPARLGGRYAEVAFRFVERISESGPRRGR